VKIKVGGETFPAHRWVLEARSPVLKADLSLAPMADGTTAELRVDDMDAEVFKTLLRFMYTESQTRLPCSRRRRQRRGCSSRQIGIRWRT
jgi:hypothetical protein